MIPTAKEFLRDNAPCSTEGFMIEFAKLHVEAALKKASISKSLCTAYTEDGLDYKENKLCKDSILNAYPLTNIK